VNTGYSSEFRPIKLVRVAGIEFGLGEFWIHESYLGKTRMRGEKASVGFRELRTSRHRSARNGRKVQYKIGGIQSGSGESRAGQIVWFVVRNRDGAGANFHTR